MSLEESKASASFESVTTLGAKGERVNSLKSQHPMRYSVVIDESVVRLTADPEVGGEIRHFYQSGLPATLAERNKLCAKIIATSSNLKAPITAEFGERSRIRERFCDASISDAPKRDDEKKTVFKKDGNVAAMFAKIGSKANAKPSGDIKIEKKPPVKIEAVKIENPLAKAFRLQALRGDRKRVKEEVPGIKEEAKREESDEPPVNLKDEGVSGGCSRVKDEAPRKCFIDTSSDEDNKEAVEKITKPVKKIPPKKKAPPSSTGSKAKRSRK